LNLDKNLKKAIWWIMVDMDSSVWATLCEFFKKIYPDKKSTEIEDLADVIMSDIRKYEMVLIKLLNLEEEVAEFFGTSVDYIKEVSTSFYEKYRKELQKLKEKLREDFPEEEIPVLP